MVSKTSVLERVIKILTFDEVAFTLVFHMFTLSNSTRLCKQILQSKEGSSSEVLFKIY